MLIKNICLVLGLLLLLVTSIRAGDNITRKLPRRCKENDRRALLQFKTGVVDDFGILSSWEEEECCNWRGIRCNNRTGHVTALSIPDFGLVGKVSPSLGEMKHLKYLNLSFNGLTGEIPHQLGNLTNLRYLDLGNNAYEMTTQNLDWVSKLHKLTHLDLAMVRLGNCTGWLNQINKLSSLTHLLLSDTRLPDPLLPLNATSFSTFKSLAVVNLSSNYFSPKGYNWLFNFTTTLVVLDLSYDFQKRGGIPEAFGRLIYLESLYLPGNKLEGMLPDSFRNLSRLATLDLSQNNFNVSLSAFLRPLATKEKNSLKVLELYENQLDGSLPDYFPKFPSLHKMTIQKNKLSGLFPDNFCQLSSSLVHLDLSANHLTGPLPNLTLFSSLETLILNGNKLEDTIPEAYFSNLSKLTHLDLSTNSLSFNFSFDWLPPFKLDKILLRNCSIGPRFPNWIRSQSNFSELDISSARISDKIPLWFWNLSTELNSLNLSSNQIEGTLPDLSVNFPNIGSIDLRNNHLQGSLLPLPVDVTYLYLANNMFTGSLSFFCNGGFVPRCEGPSIGHICPKYYYLRHLDLSSNNLSGELSANCLENINQIRTLNLANNNFSGNLTPRSPSIGLYWLVSLQLRNNSFTGQLPSWLMNSTGLRLVDLSKNKLTGKIPTWIGTRLTSLVVVSLRANEFSGSIPREICHLRDAQVLDLSQNKFTGSIPHCINNITSLVRTETNDEFEAQETYRSTTTFSITEYVNAVVQWKGAASECKRALILLKLIDLSSNRLVGRIPKEFASLAGLISLNLSSNNLTGYMIPKIGQMKKLESLDLSRNRLSGEIPSSLASLTLLGVLDLSNNDLKGEIPKSTQLQSFDPSQYAGNKQLCGLPLPKCGVVHSPPAGHDDKDNDKFPRLGLYVSVVLGFGTGFWGFVYPVMLRSTGRQSYYTLLGKITDWIYVRTISNMAKLQRKFYS